MRTRFRQLFGLSMSGSARAPCASGRACKPQGGDQAARALPNRHQQQKINDRLWICGRCAYGATVSLPWTTLHVAHRAHLRPQAPQPHITKNKNHELQDTREGGVHSIWANCSRPYGCAERLVLGLLRPFVSDRKRPQRDPKNARSQLAIFDPAGKCQTRNLQICAGGRRPDPLRHG
jgi:hypothetical protein